MMRSTHKAPAARRGAIAVKVAICLPVLLGVTALSLDGGMIYDKKRHSQAAADAAALAAAGVLFTTYTNPTTLDDGKDPNGLAVARAKAIAADNGYPDDGQTATVIVNIPPKSGPFTGKAGYVEVLITYHQQRGFSKIFGTGDLLVGARAVAVGSWAPANIGILVLDPTAPSALKIGGGAHAYVPYAPVIVNSTSSTAMYASGTGPLMQSEQFEITGNYGGGVPGINFIGPIETGVPPTPDPYLYLPQPDPSTLPKQSQQTATVVTDGAGVRTYYLEPGVYKGGLSFSGKDSVVMAKGIYYMDGGGFSFSGMGSLTALEVMLFNDGRNSSDSIKISGQGAVTWTPPSTGTYKGMTLFQARGDTQPVSLAGQGAMNIKGVLYVPNGLVSVSGNGNNYIGNQVVCWQMDFQGNGNFYVAWDVGNLVPIRNLRLVE
jgi:Putative Flp pilus-assembly TadE/G-like